MKRFLLYSFFCCLALQGNAQLNKTSAFGQINFEYNYAFPWFSIYRDTAANPNCIWQIGKPQKPVFDSARSYPNAIVTDTLQSYPPNDTSSFIIAQETLAGWWVASYAGISGWYKINSDSLTDYGSIELSVDSGATWINILTDTQYHFFDTTLNGWPIIPNRPTLTGNSNGWQYFAIDFYSFVDSFPQQIGFQQPVLLKFTFISDSVQTNKDGLMFDDIELQDWTVNIDNIRKQSVPLTVYPNPATSAIFLKEQTDFAYHKKQLTIRDVFGRTVRNEDYFNNEVIRVDVASLPPGLYSYQLSYDDGKFFSSGNFVKR
ncbi:MAG TPA: T9SS type A sorting domain-containing protein [Flavipsychrobacter sp.]|nr:T9SS type A sorting domain-containing protein [Flavipsychrobacter sp.]